MTDTILTSSQHEMETITTISDEESSRSNYQLYPRSEFTQQELHPINQQELDPINQQELDPIDTQVDKYLRKAKELQEEADRGTTSSIHRILPRLQETNGLNWYEPEMVSIGPYFYKLRNEKLKMAEDYKSKCFGSFLAKKVNQKDQTDTYKHCLQRIGASEEGIKKCYSEELEVTRNVFCEMMVVDACFILEIIGVFGDIKREENLSESLKALEWMVPYFYRDFLLLENQIPFFVLEEILLITRKIPVMLCRSNLIYAALAFFKYGMKRFDLDIFDFTSMKVWERNLPRPLHLLDLVRSSFIPLATSMNVREKNQPWPLHLLDWVQNSLIMPLATLMKARETNQPLPSQMLGFVRRSSEPLAIRNGQLELSVETPFIHCVSKLQLAGIKVRPVKARSFLEVRFNKGVIEMPNIAIDDLMRCLLLNCVAFEQCHHTIGSRYFTAYATFLDCLVNTEEDVEYLRERNVIDNYLTDDSELAGFINRAGKDLVLIKDDNGFYLRKLFEDVDKHYRSRWKWKWASFEREYFDKPWLLLSAAGGILLILATSFQAIMAFLAYKYKNC